MPLSAAHDNPKLIRTYFQYKSEKRMRLIHLYSKLMPKMDEVALLKSIIEHVGIASTKPIFNRGGVQL